MTPAHPMLLAPVFRRALDVEGLRLGDLSPRRGVGLMIQFFKNTVFDGCEQDAGGDRLVYWHGQEQGSLNAVVARQLAGPNHNVRLEVKWSVADPGLLDTTSRWTRRNLHEWREAVDMDLMLFEQAIGHARPTVSLRLQRM